MDPEYETLTEARKRLGVTRQTIWRLTQSGELPTFESALNRRVKLVRIDDVEKLRTPTPSERREETGR